MCWGKIIGMGAQAGSSGLQGEHDAATLNANASLLDQKAADTEIRGYQDESTQRNKVAVFAGNQKAQMGASGVVSTSGSFAQVQEQTAQMGEVDAQTVRNNALKEAWGFRQEASDLRAQAIASGVMQRLLLPGVEDGKFDFIPSQRSLKGPIGGDATRYIRTGRS